ncbi:hypothetical protein T07_437 [Trichinella nelsoni]|uniref:Uncharacterized protein n=1 Tax=Trichinella nelsoni TaxID=6336 RepID=A0A0V0RC22_9BILA|nr:hypothetical protein T07_437 [Trichinella nelsoni]
MVRLFVLLACQVTAPSNVKRSRYVATEVGYL